MLASGELAEIPRGLWDYVVIELEDDAPGFLAVDRNVELRTMRGSRWSARSVGSAQRQPSARVMNTHINYLTLRS